MPDNVFDYFTDLIGIEPNDRTLKDLPLDTERGLDCKEAIDQAANLIKRYDRDHTMLIDMLNEAVESYRHG